MKVDDWINIQNRIETSSSRQLNCPTEAVIVRNTDKAILIEWDDFLSGYDSIYRAWIPKSIIYIISTERKKRENQTYEYHYIMLPKWKKLDVQIMDNP